MASASSRGGINVYGGAAPYRSQDGLLTRQVGGEVGSDEIQLRIDPVHGDLDEEITGLRKQVRRLRSVAQEIDSEAKFQNDMLNQLITVIFPIIIYFSTKLRGIWSGLIGGTVVQTLLLGLITLKCDWQEEVMKAKNLAMGAGGFG